MNTAEDYVRYALERLRNVEGFDKVRFIILYGSVAEGRAKETSDIDLCVYYDGTRDEGQLFCFTALSELFNDLYDIQNFGNLPFVCPDGGSAWTCPLLS